MTITEVKQQVKKALRTLCGLAAPLFEEKTSMQEAQALKILQQCTPRPESTVFTKNALPEVRWDLQIVIPAYNVQDYLESCMESVLAQKTKYSFHVTLVDDGAKDATPEICDRYRDHPLVTVIHQKNRGLSGARNTGMKELAGRYVLFLDSDDLLAENAVEGLLDTAYARNADLVEGGAYYLMGENRTVMHRYPRDGKVTDPYAQLHGHAWGKLYRRELLETVCFPEGYWYEDSLLSFLVFSMAENIWQSAQMTTAYRINQEGIVKSSRGKPRSVETYWITEMLLRARKQAGLPMDGAFFRFMLLQLRLNQLRLSELDREVQEAAFVLSCGLLEDCFAPEVMQGKERNLIRSLKERDFGMFRMCCKFF